MTSTVCSLFYEICWNKKDNGREGVKYEDSCDVELICQNLCSFKTCFLLPHVKVTPFKYSGQC